MAVHELIQVALDEDLVRKLLEGLRYGAKNKALKVVISTAGHYQVESKELRMQIEVDGDAMKCVRINNEKLQAVIRRDELERLHLTDIADQVIRELKSKYSPVFHSLADNIVVFNRAYTDPGKEPG